MYLRKLIVAIACTLLWQQALAQADYRCTIQRVYGAVDDADPVLVQERKMRIGKEFTVDRNTGAMAGALKNAFATKPQIVDRGSKDNAFKAVTTMRIDQGAGGGSAIYALVINEYFEAERKPFTFMSGDMVYFGTCTHFQ
jgi:hypothetical protein